jgi:CRP-like cAMP-binding protein
MMANELISAFGQIKPFSFLPRQELERLSPYCSKKSIPAGAIVNSEDSWGEELWALSSGILRLSVVPPYIGQCAVAVLRSGELVGCLNGVCRQKHQLEGLALTACSFISIPRRRYLDLLADKDFGLGIIHILGERLWESQMMRAAATQTSETRLAWTLLWLHGKLGRTIPMTRRLIAETAGVARETSIRMLSPMEKKGWLKTRRGLLEIVRPDKLKEMLEGR